MFTPAGLFKGVFCTAGADCQIPNCMFDHSLCPQNIKEQPEANRSTLKRKAPSSTAEGGGSSAAEDLEQPPGKRRLLDEGRADAKQGGPSDDSRRREHAPPDRTVLETAQVKSINSLTKAVSPPPTNGKATRLANNTLNSNDDKRRSLHTNDVPKESLNPRMLPNAPAGHGVRAKFLGLLHTEFVRQNKSMIDSDHKDKQWLMLSDNELIKFALDEEEKIARNLPKLYENVFRSRFATFKKMKLEQWGGAVRASFPRVEEKNAEKEAKALNTGLSSTEEVDLLSRRLVADQSTLAQHGYIPMPPTEAEAAEAVAGVQAALSYEMCDRCSSRFRVFPDREGDEPFEALLTSNGPCVHHPVRSRFPPRQKTDNITGGREALYGCCNEPVGTRGCTTTEHHVFVAKDPKRLAAVLPFIITPDNDSPAKGPDGKVPAAVSFDCEMGYTVYGLELIRLTAVSWPEGTELIDILVRPLGTILDLNSRFSGVWPETYTAATPYSSSLSQPPATPSLPIVPNPQAARALLCSYLTPRTPLIGHAIENDLNATRLCHPTIVDTVLLFPHPRGLPLRYGLKMLAKQKLGRDIQTGGDRGHDSLEDARATGDLVRFRIGEMGKRSVG